MARARAVANSPLAAALRERARRLPNDRQLAVTMSVALELPLVRAAAGSHVPAQLLYLESLLTRAIADLADGVVSSDVAANLDYERRARVANVLFQLGARDGRDITTRRRDICTRIWPGDVDAFRQGYELDTYQILADHIELLDRAFREEIGLPVGQQDDKTLLTRHLLAHIAAPTNALISALLWYFRASAVVDKNPDADQWRGGAGARTLTEAERRRNFERVRDGVMVFAMKRMRMASLTSGLYALARWSAESVPVFVPLATWTGSGAELARHVSDAMGEVKRGVPFSSHVMGRLRTAARTCERTAFIDALGEPKLAGLLSRWESWLREACDRPVVEFIPIGADAAAAVEPCECAPHRVLGALWTVSEAIDESILDVATLVGLDMVAGMPRLFDDLDASGEVVTMTVGDDDEAIDIAISPLDIEVVVTDDGQ